MTIGPLRMFTLSAGLCWVIAAAANGQVVFDGAVLDAGGKVERAGIASIRGEELSVIDPKGGTRTRPLGDTIALVPASWAEQVSAPVAPDAWALAGSPFIELVDGQRFVGRPGRIAADGETIAWVHERFGTLLFPLDQVSRFVMRPAAAPLQSAEPEPGKSDVLWLVNGDRLEGYLESVGPRAGGEGFTLTIDTGGGSAASNRVAVPVDQIVRARFANPRRLPQGAVAWLADGSVVGLSSIQTDVQRGMLSLTAAAAAHTAPPAGEQSESPASTATAGFLAQDVSAVLFDSSRVFPLAGMTMVAHRPIGLPRRSGPRVDSVDAIPLPLGAADIVIPGPMEIEWALPTGATRLVGTARLDEPDWAWGECSVVVELLPTSGPARELARASLGGANTSAAVAAELGAPGSKAGDRLRVRVEAGELGPIRDRVRLERFLLLR